MHPSTDYFNRPHHNQQQPILRLAYLCRYLKERRLSAQSDVMTACYSTQGPGHRPLTNPVPMVCPSPYLALSSFHLVATRHHRGFCHPCRDCLSAVSPQLSPSCPWPPLDSPHSSCPSALANCHHKSHLVLASCTVGNKHRFSSPQ